MRPRLAFWCAFFLVLVGAFLPWAELDLRKATEDSDGFAALGAMLASFAGTIEVSAWNGRVEVGTAHIPVWVALVAAAVAVVLAEMRARGMRSVPYPAGPVLALVALVIVVLFGIQARDAAHFLAGWWVTLAGSMGLMAASLRDSAPAG